MLIGLFYYQCRLVYFSWDVEVSELLLKLVSPALIRKKSYLTARNTWIYKDEIILSCTEDIGPKDEFILSCTEHMGL